MHWKSLAVPTLWRIIFTTQVLYFHCFTLFSSCLFWFVPRPFNTQMALDYALNIFYFLFKTVPSLNPSSVIGFIMSLAVSRQYLQLSPHLWIPPFSQLCQLKSESWHTQWDPNRLSVPTSSTDLILPPESWSYLAFVLSFIPHIHRHFYWYHLSSEGIQQSLIASASHSLSMPPPPSTLFQLLSNCWPTHY